MKTGLKIVLIIVLLAGAIAGVTIMNKAPAPSGDLVHEVERSVFPVEVLMMTPRTVSETLNRTGILLADKDVTLDAQVAGTVKNVHKRLGDKCKKGEAVVQLDRENYQIGVSQANAAVKQTRVSLDQAERNLARMEKLKESAVATEQQYDSAVTGVEASKAALDQARAAQRASQKSLKDTKVRCPFDGQIAQTMVEVGQSVGPTVPIARIVDAESLKLVIEVPGRQLSQIELEQRVQLTDPNAPQTVVPGEVTRIGIAANEMTRTFPVEIRTSPSGLLRTGQVVNAVCELKLHENVLLVPREAITSAEGEEPRVMVVKGGLAKSVAISLGPHIENEFVVTAGLSPGDKVVTVGHDTLEDGAPVKAVNETPIDSSPVKAVDKTTTDGSPVKAVDETR